MYNRYIPEGERWVPVEETPPPPPQEPKHRREGGQRRPGGEWLSALLKKLRPEEWDTGDLLLGAILLLIWREGEDRDLLLAVVGALLLGGKDGAG